MRKFVVLTFFVVITACSERDVPNPVVYRSAPALAKYKIPAFLNPGREYTLSVSAQTSGIEQKVDSVRLEVFKKGESTALFFYVLYDDGQAVHENDGDVVAFDGIFSQKLTWNPATAMREKYMFVFSAADDKGRSSEPLQIEVVSLDNVSPVIVDATGPDSLLSGFDGRQLFEIVAIDSNGTDDILGATFRLERDQTVYTQGPMESQLSTTTYDSGLVAFSLAVDSSFAAGLSGRYDLVFEVTDRSDVVSLPYKKESYLENKAPVVFNLEAASTVEKPKTGITTFLIKISVRDPQSSKDIKNVKMSWQKPDSSFAGESPYDLYDNGKPFDLNPSRWQAGFRGDEVEGDGVYSITGIFDPSQPEGQYKLVFWAVDLVENKSNQIVHYIEFK